MNSKILAIEVRQVSKQIKGKKILDDVSFVITKGRFHALVGENGSGKSTITKIILGNYSPLKYTGVVKKDKDTTLSFFPEITTFPRNWNVGQYLDNIAILNNRGKKENELRVQNAVKNMRLENLLKLKPKSLSSGQKKRVLLGRVEIEDANTIILDEPATNLDIASRKFLFDKLKKFNKQGKTIVIISHLLKEINEYINEVTIMNLGKVFMNKKIKEKELENEYQKVFKKIWAN